MRDRRLDPRLGDHGFLQLRRLHEHMRLEAEAAGRATVVDIGCGPQPYAQLFRGRYIGTDIFVSPLARPALLTAGEAVALRAAVADVVISTQNLEHVEDPDLVLSEAARLLRPDGTLLLSTHGVWVHHPDPHDYWRWTEQGLVKLIESHGFHVERVHRQGEVFAAGLGILAYPFSAAGSQASGAVGFAGRAVVATLNVVALVLERVLAPHLPRHLASPSYLVVARRST